jgi:hypothetical protein
MAPHDTDATDATDATDSTTKTDAQAPRLASDLGPTVDLEAVSLPVDVGEGLQRFYGTADPPRTAREWVDANRTALDVVEGERPTVDDLCSTADGDHAFVAGEGGPSQDYVCVLDPLAYPFITDTPGLIKSTSQVREATITVDVRVDDVIVSHPDAVLSIGVATDVDAVEATPEVIYRQVCGYIHAFADAEEYETWAGSVDAATTSVAVDTGIAIARALAEDLFA